MNNKGLEALKHLYTRAPSTTNAICVMDYEIIQKELKTLEFIKETLNLKVYKNKLGQCFLEGTNILMAINQENYDMLKEVLL